jgi:hypothetical protein
MSFTYRILVYFIGIMLGTVLVYFMLFRGRDRDIMAWLPGERVIAKVKENTLTTTPYSLCRMECFGVTLDEIQERTTGAKVAFGRSETSKPCPKYLIEINQIDFAGEVYIEVCDTISILQEITVINKENCNC